MFNLTVTVDFSDRALTALTRLAAALERIGTPVAVPAVAPPALPLSMRTGGAPFTPPVVSVAPPTAAAPPPAPVTAVEPVKPVIGRPAKARPAAATFRGWKTFERTAKLRELWPTETPFSEVYAALAKLPGPPMPPGDGVRAAAKQHGLSRPSAMLPASFPQNRTPHPTEGTAAQNLAQGGGSTHLPASAPSVGSPAPIVLPQVAAPQVEAPQVEAVTARVTHQAGAPVPRFAPSAPLTEPITAGQEAIRTWAAQRGVTMGAFDLAAVNKKAKAIGHPGFILKTPERFARHG
jgi:hypothetical protein